MADRTVVITDRDVEFVRLALVLAIGEHLCMTMRGIKTPSRMTSSALSGVFRSDARAREEFLRIVALSARG